jgi:Lysozyme like domain
VKGKWPALAVAAAVLYAGSQHAGAGPASAVTTDAIRGTARGGTLDCVGLERLWEQAGGSPSEAFTAAEIAMAESGGQQYATDTNGGRSTDRGYFQINSTHGALSTYDAYGNARAAVLISDDGTNWSPWVTYERNMYQGRC